MDGPPAGYGINMMQRSLTAKTRNNDTCHNSNLHESSTVDDTVTTVTMDSVEER